MDNLTRTYMRVDGCVAWVSLGVTILSFISYMITHSKKTRWY
jgi:hypothetical protein